MSWIYIVAVIIFAIVSNVNKAAKNKPKGAPRGGMPTFGGGQDNPLRHNKETDANGEQREQSGSGFPTPVATTSREYDASPAFPEPAYIPTPNYVSGEGMSLEQPDENDGVELRTKKCRRSWNVFNLFLTELLVQIPKERKRLRIPLRDRQFSLMELAVVMTCVTV